MTRKADLNAMRPTECPNWDTMRECGKAYRSGCRQTPCTEGKFQEKAGTPAAKRDVKVKPATARPLAKPGIIQYIEKVEKENLTRPKGTVNESGWIWHTEECCRRVWRPAAFGCSK